MKKRIALSDHFTYSRLIRFTLPSMAMMIFISIYGVVDGFFVSNFAGKTPFAAVNLIFPLLMMFSSVGFIFGTGGSAIVANALGAGDKERANRCFSLFTYVALVLGVILAAVGFVFIRPISIALGATGELLEFCVVYGRINLLALPFNVLQFYFQSFLVTAEKPQIGLFVTISSGVTNMVLDAVLVLLLPKPYKLIGAAIATAMSQVVGGAVPFVYFLRKNDSLLHLCKTRWDKVAVGKACMNGSSEFMSNVSMNLVGMLYNIQLLKYAGENGVAAYGVMMYVSLIFAAAFIGYSIGTAPIFGYHQGANNYSELRSLLRKSLVMIAIFGVSMVALAEALAYPLAKIFVGYDGELMDLTVSGFRIYGLSFLFMGMAIFGSGFFTALNDGLTSALIAFLRTLVFQIAAVLLLPLVLGIDGIWYSVIVAELMAAAFCGIFMVIKRKKYHY